MSYKLYTDRNENFECEVSVKNASLKGSIARLIVESEGVSLVFNGKIEGEKCIIPVKRLRGLLDENVRGNMQLEVIIEDTYFQPWKSDFVVEEHTSVKVKVNENAQVSNKPIVQVKVPVKSSPKAVSKKIVKESKGINVFIPLKEISTICERFGVKKINMNKKKTDLIQILREYFKSNTEYKNHKSTILSKLPSFMK